MYSSYFLYPRFLFTCMLLCGIPCVFNLPAQTITPELIADLRSVTEVAISPGGNEIAYTLRVPGGDASGMQKSVLMIVPKSGGTPKVVLDKAYSPYSISWSKDGKNIFCLIKDTVKKISQLSLVQLANKDVNTIATGNNSVNHYAFSPDEKLLALIYTDPETEQEKSDIKMKRDWDVKGANQKFDRLYITDGMVSYAPKEISTKTLNVGDLVWAPDGKTIYFKATENPGVDLTYMYQRIYKISSQGGTPELVCETAGKLGSLDISPDGKQLAFCGATDISDPLAQSVFVVPSTGGEAKNLTGKYEGSVVEIKWINPITMIALTAEGCYSALKKIDLKTGKMTPVYGKSAIIRTMSLDVKSGAMAFAASTPQNPGEVYSGTIAGGLSRRTESNPEFKNVKLTKQEVISWLSSDGMKIEGVLTYPRDYRYGTKYPLLLQLHGGPEGVSSNGWNTNPLYPVQLYAANGFFVLEPNYRGSQGRGVSFAKANHKDLGGKEFDDILGGVDLLVSKGMVDNDRVGTGGFSYGGYLSAWAGTKHSPRFKAAMMGAGISNWISFSGTTEIIHEMSLVHWDVWWNDSTTLVWNRSPLAHINTAKTPMLIVHGGADTRVPLSQSEEMYNALKLRKVPVQMVVYKRQPHGILEREAKIDFMNRTLTWFKEYVK
jgi:dipeptidyl aminopeptidase/acylaminoacyl peptidase